MQYHITDLIIEVSEMQLILLFLRIIYCIAIKIFIKYVASYLAIILYISAIYIVPSVLSDIVANLLALIACIHTWKINSHAYKSQKLFPEARENDYANERNQFPTPYCIMLSNVISHTYKDACKFSIT